MTFDQDIDVFVIETRAQMETLTGMPITGFAHRDARAVFLVTNREWRSFERHELMHVLAHHVWGPAAAPSAWIEEGLAQFADGRCGTQPVESVAYALSTPAGPIPIETLVARFRELDDLGAYMQAASMVGYLYHQHGRDALRTIWQRGLHALASVTGRELSAFTADWWSWLSARATPVEQAKLAEIRDRGCG